MRNFQITKTRMLFNEDVNRNVPVLPEQFKVYGQVMVKSLSIYAASIGKNVNISVYNTSAHLSLVIMVLSFETHKKKIYQYSTSLGDLLIGEYEHLTNNSIASENLNLIMNYNRGNDIYIVCPNQQRFWTSEMAEINASKIMMGLLSESN